MAFLIPIVVYAVVAIAVEKIAQAITGQGYKKTTIPIGPFNIQVGEGKPQFGVGLNIPITKGVGISFGVMAGSGKKPTWNIGVSFGGKLGKTNAAGGGIRFNVTPEWTWTGGEFKKGSPSVSASLTKYKTSTESAKDKSWLGKLWEANFGQKKLDSKQWELKTKIEKEQFSVSAGMKNGVIKLTKPKKGGIIVELDVLYAVKTNKETGQELKVGAGIRFGKGKPIFKLSGGIDLTKQYTIELDKTFGSKVNDLAVSLSRYKMEDGKRKEIAQKGTFKYNAVTKTNTLQLEGKQLIPLSFNLANKKIQNVVLDTQAITDYITQKLMPYPEDISWQKKLGQLIEEPILKGVKLVSGEKIPNKLMEFLAANFGGAEGKPFQRAISEDWKNFVEGFAFPKTPEKLPNWQVDMLQGYSKDFLFGISDKYKDLGPLLEKIKKPTESNLADSFLKGQISIQDYLNKTSYNVKDLAERYYDVTKENNQLSSLSKIKDFLSGNPMEVGDKLKELLHNQPAAKNTILQEYYKNLPETKKATLFNTWKNFLGELQNVAKGIPASIDMAAKIAYSASGAPDTAYVDGQVIKLPRLDFLTAEESKKIMTEYAISLVKSFSTDILMSGSKIIEDANKIADEHPFIMALTLGTAPFAQSLWRNFSEEPLTAMINASIVSSNLKFFSNQARFVSALTRPEAAGLAGAGLEYVPGKFAQTTFDLAQSLETASTLTDPMNVIFGTAKTGISTFLNDKFPPLAKSLERRTDLSDLLDQGQHAKIMQQVIAERDATSSFIQNLSMFNKEEQLLIRKAMVTGDMTILPATWTEEAFAITEGKQVISKLQAAQDAISQNSYLEKLRQRLALESGIMDVEQMQERIWADAEKTYGMTRETLLSKGFIPTYVPYLAEQNISGPIKEALDTLKPRFEKEFVGDIKTVEKLPLEQTIAKHHVDFVKEVADQTLIQKYIDYTKQQGFATPWKLGQTLEKGNVIWDPYRYVEQVKKQLAFNDEYFKAIDDLGGDAEAGLQYVLAKYSTLGGAEKELEALMNPTKPVFQVPRWVQYELESNLNNVFKIPLFIERPTAWAKTAYLAGRVGWLVNDFKDNALRVLMQEGGNPNLALLAKKYEPLYPDELNFHGIGYELMNESITPAASGSEWKKFISGTPGQEEAAVTSFARKVIYSNNKLNNFMGKLDAGIDKLARKTEYSSEFIKEFKRGLLKDYAANFAYRWQELDKVTMEMIEEWAKNPAAYGKEIALAQERVMKVINGTLYDGSKVLPFLTKSEKTLFKTVFLFPEFMIDCMKKASTLGIRYPYQSTALSNLTDMYTQYLVSEKDRPKFLQDAMQLGTDVFLRNTAGTMFDPEWGLMNPNATMNPLVQATIEYITGKKLQGIVDEKTGQIQSPFGAPLTDPTQLAYFNPLTQKMEIINKAKTLEEVQTNIDAYQKGIVTLLDEITNAEEEYRKTGTLMAALDAGAIQYRLNIIDQAQRMISQVFKPQIEMLQSGVTATAPSLAELFLRKMPQYKLLEDALQPYTKADTGTIFNPLVILDKKTGQPKHDINVWLETLRLLGASVFQFDIDKWKKEQETLKKQQQTVTFSQLISRLAIDDPAMLAAIREDIISGKIPLNWKELPWHAEIESMFGKAAMISPLSLPTDTDMETQVKAIEYARQSDKQAIDDQAAEAINNLKFFQPEVLSKMRSTIDAIATEKKSQIDSYYDTMKQSGQMMDMLDEIKSATALKDKLNQMTSVVTADSIVKEIVNNVKLSGAQVKTKAADLSRALSDYLVNALRNNTAIDYKAVVKELAGVLGQNVKITGSAVLDALNKFVKIPASVTLAKQQAQWATNRLNEIAFLELKKQVSGTYPDVKFLAPDLQQILAEDVFRYYLGDVYEEDVFKGIDLLTDKDLVDAITVINADALTAIDKIKASAMPFGNLVIKSVEKKAKETIAKVKVTYKKKQRMQALFTKEKIANARTVLEQATAARRDFLSAMSFSHWKDIYNPESITAASGKVPISALLLALGAARLEILNQFGKSELDKFLATEEGQQYTSFEEDVLKDYYTMVEETQPLISPTTELPKIIGGFQLQLLQPTAQPVVAQGNAMDFYNAYKAFLEAPSKGGFGFVKGVHSRMIDEKQKMPVFYRDSADGTLYATSSTSTWKENELFGTKLQELDTYSRVYATPEYKAIEQATFKQYTKLEKKITQGEKTGNYFYGVLLQK